MALLRSQKKDRGIKLPGRYTVRNLTRDGNKSRVVPIRLPSYSHRDKQIG